MLIAPPIDILTGSTLVSTNAGTSGDPSAYDATHSYSIGDTSFVGEVIYISIADANVGNSPALLGLYWKRKATINSMAMFDGRVGSQTENPDTIDVTLRPGDVINLLSILNTQANSVTVIQTSPVDGIVYTETQSMLNIVGDWWEYLYTPIVAKKKLLFTGFLPYRDATVRVIIDYTGSTAKCGALIVAQSYEYGKTAYGSGDSIDDYSDVEFDEWGVKDITERDYADDAELNLDVMLNDTETFRDLLADRRAQPTLLVLDPSRPSAQYYGLVSFKRTFPFWDRDSFALTVKGLT